MEDLPLEPSDLLKDIGRVANEGSHFAIYTGRSFIFIYNDSYLMFIVEAGI